MSSSLSSSSSRLPSDAGLSTPAPPPLAARGGSEGRSAELPIPPVAESGDGSTASAAPCLRERSDRVGRAAGTEEGKVAGKEEGREESDEEGMVEGREEGWVEGWMTHREEGREEGSSERLSEGRLEDFEGRFSPPFGG